MRVEAPIKVDRKTKRLAKRLTGREIAVINHMDIDEVAANSLVEGKVKLVINAAQSISGKYPNKGPGILTDKNILIIDDVYTTGATVNELSKTLRKLEPDKIYVLTAGKTLFHNNKDKKKSIFSKVFLANNS